MQRIKPSSFPELAVIIIICFLLLNSLRTFQQVITQNPNQLASIRVERNAQRSEAVRTFLPARGYIGYISDESNASAYFRDYYGLQYGLSPLMFVIIGSMPDNLPYQVDPQSAIPPLSDGLVLGVFRNPEQQQLLMQQFNLELVTQIDAEFVVLRQKSPQP